MASRPVRAMESPVASIYGKGQVPHDVTDAVLLVDKPIGCTSFDVVRRLRRLLSVRKVGHAGTLDPMATGLLICLLGRATKRMQTYMHMRKVYAATMRLGEVTASYDAETLVSATQDWGHVTDAALEEARKRFVGSIWQTPPMYSARRIGGERLYKKARRGESVERGRSEVTIYRLAMTGRTGGDVTFEVACSKGTYIRSLAHDMGQVLGVGAHLVALRRTAIGPHQVEDAWGLDELKACSR